MTSDKPPLIPTLRPYQKDWLSADISAGLLVAILIVPQAIAYAFLAGLPAEAGLYAALLPLVVYALLGTSPTLAVGPVAIVSLMTLEALAPLATDAIPLAVYASGLALLVAGFLLLFYLIGLGNWTSFISHSVISAFTSAAAIVIILNQVKHFTGLEIPKGHNFEPLVYLWNFAADIFWPALILAGGTLAMLIIWPKIAAGKLAKAGPMLAVVSGIAAVLFSGVEVSTVGQIPSGLPIFQLPELFIQHSANIDWHALLPSAAIIALIAYLESLSVATAMGLQTRSRIEPNRELLALGFANIAAAISQSYPVAGGFGRSMVNMSAGAKTQLAAIVTAIFVAIVCLFFSDWFVNLPKATLGAIIVAAVIPLINWRDGLKAWQFNKSDGVIWLITFIAVLASNAETGIFIGILLSLTLYLRRSSQPHIAEVGRYQESDHFRNIDRHQVTTCPNILMIRIDENLYFANSQYLQDFIEFKLKDSKDIQHIILIGSAINHIDFNGYETLISIIQKLKERNILLHLAEFKGPITDQLKTTKLIEKLSPGRLFFTASEAMKELGGR